MVTRVVQVKLLPDPSQTKALADTLAMCNEQASRISNLAREQAIYRNYDLRKVTYADALDAGLGSQVAQLVIKKVADSYATLKANLKAGNYGKPGSKRRTKVETNPIVFRRDAAQAFDDRCLSWSHDQQTVSIWTTRGRLKNVRFVGSPDDLKLLREHRKGESDLFHRDGNWFLIACVRVEAEPLNEHPSGWLGGDMGIVTILHTSDGQNWSGGAITARREKNQKIRTTCQQKGTKSAKRRLKARRRKEARFVRDVNHQISKHIVETAKRTGTGIALENLTGIRARVRHRKPQRSTLNSWSFRQLGDFIAYKAEQAGVPLMWVNPAYTSQTCSECGHRDKRNRTNQETFTCRRCGIILNADYNAAINIAALGQTSWEHQILGVQSTTLMQPASPAASRNQSRKPSPSGLGS